MITPSQEVIKINDVLVVNNTQPPTPTIIIKKAPTATPVPKTAVSDKAAWGVATQVGEHTWTMKIQQDGKMATPGEILEALNHYRQVHNSGVLQSDNNLTNFAQKRAEYLNSIKNVDEHKGFREYLENEDGYHQLGFYSLGENISYGYKLEAVHLIEWAYGADDPHNKNQLDNSWSRVGIGVDGLATCLIFAKDKI